MGSQKSKPSFENHNLKEAGKYHITKCKISENSNLGTKLFIGVNVDTREDVVVKILTKKKEEDNMSKKHSEFIKREIDICMKLNHEHIVKYCDVIDFKDSILLISEYCSGGTLFDYVESETFLSEDETGRLFGQLLSAIEYLHVNFIAHRDLKHDNILLDENKNIKLADFGFSINALLDNKRTSTCGSLGFFAPEVVLSKTGYFPLLSETWSLGIILFYMVTGEIPYTEEEYMNRITKGNLVIRFSEYEINANFKQLIREMLVMDHTMRINLNSIKKREFLKPFVKNNTYNLINTLDIDKIKTIVNLGYDENDVIKAIYNNKDDPTHIYIGMYQTLERNSRRLTSRSFSAPLLNKLTMNNSPPLQNKSQ